MLAAANNSVTVQFSSVSNLYSWIGRSLYSGDPYADLNEEERAALMKLPRVVRLALGPRILRADTAAVAALALVGAALGDWS